MIGPIENYEDQLFNYKAAHEAYVLVKDMEWSKRLAKYAAFLPELQAGIPVPAEYKKEKPGNDAELNAYDVIYYAGDCNAGSKNYCDQTYRMTKKFSFKKVLVVYNSKMQCAQNLIKYYFI